MTLKNKLRLIILFIIIIIGLKLFFIYTHHAGSHSLSQFNRTFIQINNHLYELSVLSYELTRDFSENTQILWNQVYEKTLLLLSQESFSTLNLPLFDDFKNKFNKLYDVFRQCITPKTQSLSNHSSDLNLLISWNFDLVSDIIAINEYSRQQLMSMEKKHNQMIMMVGLTMIAVLFFIIIVIRYAIVRPITILKEEARTICQEQKSLPTKNLKINEASFLSHCFKQLLSSLKESKLSQDQLSQKLQDRQKTELKLFLTTFALNHTKDAAFWINAAHGIGFMNGAAAEMLEYSAEECAQLSVFEIDSQLTPDKITNFWETLKKNHFITYQSMLKAKSNQLLPVEITAHYLEFQDNPFAVFYIRNIHDQDKTQAALKKNMYELHQANLKIRQHQDALIKKERLRVLLQMARSTAHELNQPLTILSGNLQMLIKHKENPEKSEQYLAKIEEASVRLTETIRKIQTIQQDDLQNYLGNTNLTEANPATNIIYCGIKKELFAFIDHFFSTQTQSIIYWAKNEADIRKILEKNVIHFIFMEYNLPSFNTIEFINHLKARQISVPIFILSDRKNDKIAAKVLAAGAQDFLPRAKITENRLHLLYNQFHRFN